MTTIAQIQTIVQEFNNFKNSYNIAGSALANVITTGTTLYNDAVMASEFPNSWTTYQAYLVDLQDAINTFIAGLPAEPPLSG